MRSRSGGAPTGASTSADNATKTDIKTEAATTAAPSLFWSPWPRRLLIGFRPTAARLGSSVRCVCAAGCYAPLTASREGPPWAFGTGTSTAPSPRTCLDRGGTRIRVLISNVCRLYYDPHSLIYRKATRLVSPWHAQAHVVAFRRPVPPDPLRPGTHGEYRTRRVTAALTAGARTEALTERRFAAFTTPSDELRHAHSRTALRRRRCARLSAPLRAYYAPRLAPALELYTRKAQLRTRAEACAHAAGGR